MTATMPGTVLIVDDTPANLAIVAEHLEEQGLRVLVAQGGEEALARAARVRPDLILLDVMMPGLDGFETCRRLKAMETTQAIPVLFMSALSDAHSKLEGFEAGAIDYITKPVDIAEVLVRVRTHLTLRSMQFRLEAMSISDPLTGLANRRRFDTILRSEWQRALRGSGSVGAIMIDIDLFKRYNDYYGHVGGDRCLCAVARAVQSVVRQEIDLAARYGGEEFVLILPGADSAAVAEVAIRAHAAVLALNEPHAAAETGCVTVSVGAAALAPASEAGMGRLIELADEALYRAKQQGRNQVAVQAPCSPAHRSPLPDAASGRPMWRQKAGFRKHCSTAASAGVLLRRWQRTSDLRPTTTAFSASSRPMRHSVGQRRCCWISQPGCCCQPRTPPTALIHSGSPRRCDASAHGFGAPTDRWRCLRSPPRRCSIRTARRWACAVSESTGLPTMISRRLWPPICAAANCSNTFSFASARQRTWGWWMPLAIA